MCEGARAGTKNLQSIQLAASRRELADAGDSPRKWRCDGILGVWSKISEEIQATTWKVRRMRTHSVNEGFFLILLK